MLNATVANEINFFQHMYYMRMGRTQYNKHDQVSLIYGRQQTAEDTFGTHPLVIRFLKGVVEMKPSLPRYTYVWLWERC